MLLARKVGFGGRVADMSSDFGYLSLSLALSAQNSAVQIQATLETQLKSTLFLLD